jgi:RNA polymerase sigma-70 factor (ECF subfamily)
MEGAAESFYDDSREAELVRLAQRDKAGFQPLYARWVTPVYKYLLFQLGSPADAEDLTSQTFLKAFQALPTYRPTARFAAWLFTIARNLLRDFYRRSRREVDIDAAGELSTSDFRGECEQREEIAALRRLIRSLPEEERELIRLRYVARLSFAEIGDLLGKREDAVKKSLYRLHTRMQTMLEVNHD